MGACGCGDFQGDFKFPGPGNITYVLQVYPPCNYCETPAGIILYAMSPDDCNDWGVDAMPEINIKDVGTLISVIHPKELMTTIIQGIESYIEEGINDVFTSAIHQAIQDNHHLNVDKITVNPEP